MRAVTHETRYDGSDRSGDSEPARGRPRHLVRLIVSTVIFLGSSGAPVQAEWIWTAGEGWSNRDRNRMSTAAEMLAETKKAHAANAWNDTIVGCLRLRRTYPVNRESRESLPLLAESQFRTDELKGALRTIEEALLQKPDSATVTRIVQLKYEIGMKYINGAPRFIFGIPVSGKGTGIRILKEVTDRYPFQSYSDDALFHVAGSYAEDGKLEEAEAVYQRLIRVYPKSEWVEIAEYQIGETALKRLKGVEYDFGLVDVAENAFRRYLRRYPEGGKREEARKRLDLIAELRARKLLGIATFYLKEKRPKAARFYLQRLLKDHPEAAVAPEARRLLRTVGAPDGK